MKGWKTVIFNTVLGLISTPGSPLELLPPKYSIPALTIGNFILRIVTTTPIGRK